MAKAVYDSASVSRALSGAPHSIVSTTLSSLQIREVLILDKGQNLVVSAIAGSVPSSCHDKKYG